MLKLTFGQRAVCLSSTIVFLLVSIDCFGRNKPLMLVGVLSLFLSTLSVFMLLSDPECSSTMERIFKKDKPGPKSGAAIGSAQPPVTSPLRSTQLSPEEVKALYAVKPDPEEVQDYMIKIGVLRMKPDEALNKLLQERKSRK